MAETRTTAAGTARTQAASGEAATQAGSDREGTPVATITPAGLPAALAASCRTLRDLLPALTDDGARGASALPGWTRGHVLSHIEGIGLAVARQARYARRGEQIALYDGGWPERDAGIEAGYGRSAHDLTQAVLDALDVAEASWGAVTPDDWARPVTLRDGTLFDMGLIWWREAEIHAADALLGTTPADWSPQLCAHLADHYATRVPDGTRLTLRATDAAWTATLGDGTPVELAGRMTDLAAWLAGRATADALTGDPAPELDPSL